MAVQTMVGTVEAGELDWGDEDAQFAKVTAPLGAGGSDNIRVAVRPRPANKRELAGDGGGVCVSVNEPAAVVTVEGAPPFSYDVTFDMGCTQLQVRFKTSVQFDICLFYVRGTS